MENFRPLKRN